VGGDQVPDAGLQHEPQRVEAAGDVAVAGPVADVEAGAGPHGIGHGRQVRRPLLAGEPARRIDVEALRHACRPRPQLGRQRGQHLRLRDRQHRPEPELRGAGRSCTEHQRRRLVGAQAVERVAPALHEADAPGRAGLGPQRHAGLLQRGDVAVDRPDRHLERSRELGSGGPTGALHVQEDGDEAPGAHGRTIGG
jgi:hypothetical protein